MESPWVYTWVWLLRVTRVVQREGKYEYVFMLTNRLIWKAFECTHGDIFFWGVGGGGVGLGDEGNHHLRIAFRA